MDIGVEEKEAGEGGGVDSHRFVQPLVVDVLDDAVWEEISVTH